MNSKKPSDESEKLLTIDSLLHEYSQLLQSISAGLDNCARSLEEILAERPLVPPSGQSPNDSRPPHSN